MCVLALLSAGCASGVAQPERGQVLWVDDRPAGGRREAGALQELGLQVTTATSNAQAVELFRQHRYALVISDIHRQDPEPSTAGLALPAALRPDSPRATALHLLRGPRRRAVHRGRPARWSAGRTQLLHFVRSGASCRAPWRRVIRRSKAAGCQSRDIG